MEVSQKLFYFIIVSVPPRALRVRKKTGGENMPVQLIGDLLASELAHMQPYIRFCSCQLNAAALLQSRTHNQPDFKNFLKVRFVNGGSYVNV